VRDAVDNVVRAGAPVWILPKRCTVPMPLYTRPKIVCLPSSQGVGANVTKNCTAGERA